MDGPAGPPRRRGDLRGGRDGARAVARAARPHPRACSRGGDAPALGSRSGPLRGLAGRGLAGPDRGRREPARRRATPMTDAIGPLLGLVLAAAVVAVVAWRLVGAVRTFRARSLTPALYRRLARWVKPRSYSDEEFFTADGADSSWAARRRHGLERLAAGLRTAYPRSRAWAAEVGPGFSDLRFTDANRVPFPFARVMRERFELCSVVTASDGPRLIDIDGHATLDVGGSYGVNVAGFGRYKEWMAKGLERVRDLGPVLGPLHPVTAENI